MSKRKGSPHDVSNYRLVSELSIFSEVFEKKIYTMVSKICVKHKIFLLKINSVKKKRNTELATVSLLNKLLPVLKEKKICYM